jgi:hypothetical protein
MTRTHVNPTALDQRRHSIQQQWSADERQRRARRGLERSRALFALLLSAASEEQEVSAVGAATCEDWRRLAG